jgi:peptidoglycan/LPS O-acetylase OafA/YrhL
MSDRLPNRSMIPALTGLRAIAAAMIFFYHWFFEEAESLPLVLRAPFDVGYVAVPMFFALSGFVITTRYHAAFDQRRITFGTYLLRRFTRIYPIYFVVLTLFVMALNRPTQMVPRGARAIAATYGLAQALFPSLLLLGTQVGWTLTLEVMFYLVAPVLMRWMGRGKSLPAVVLRALALSLVALASGLLVARLPFTESLPDTLVGAPDTYIMHYSIFGHLPDFLAGMVAGFLFLRRNTYPQLSQHSGRLISLSAVGMFVLFVALDVSTAELGAPLNRTLAFGVALFSSGLILGFACDDSQAHPITRGLGSRAMVYLGSISYALFLIQLTEPCQWVYWVLLGQTLGIEHRILQAVLLYVAATLLAAVLYELVERRAQRWLGAGWVKNRLDPNGRTS